MENVKQLLREAKDKVNTADHLAYVSYPEIADSKMLFAITDGLATAVTKAMEAVLAYERMFKRIPLAPKDFGSEFELFKDKCVPSYGMDKKYVTLIDELNKIVELKKHTPLEFSRKDKIVLCTESYRMKEVDLKKVKEYLQLSKEFVDQVSGLLKC